MVRKLEISKEKKREDHAKVKRTEWHVHSNFSEMDGVCAIEEFIQTAYDWGMDSIGVCDHQVVQAFPMAQHKIEALVNKIRIVNLKCCMVAKCLWQILNIILYIIMIIANLKMQHLSCLT